MQLLDFPDEIFVHEILPWLDSLNDLCNVALVCRRLRNMTNEDCLWQALIPDIRQVVLATRSPNMCKMKEIALRESRRFTCHVGYSTSFLHSIQKMEIFACGFVGSKQHYEFTKTHDSASLFATNGMRSSWVDGRIIRTSGWELIDARPSPGIGHVIGISVGIDHSVMVTNHGKAYGFGNNRHGQLGVASFTKIAEEYLIPFGVPLRRVTCGRYSTFGICFNNKKVLACGKNKRRLLAVDSKASKIYVPVESHFSVAPDKELTIVSISPDYRSTVGLYSNGKCSYVYNDFLNEAILADNIFVVRISITSGRIAILSRGGECYVSDIRFWSSTFTFLDFAGLSKLDLPNGIPFVDIASGSEHVVAINAINQIYTFGSNDFGECGVPLERNLVLEPQLVELATCDDNNKCKKQRCI